MLSRFTQAPVVYDILDYLRAVLLMLDQVRQHSCRSGELLALLQIMMETIRASQSTDTMVRTKLPQSLELSNYEGWLG